jgi:hypothetical protein
MEREAKKAAKRQKKELLGPHVGPKVLLDARTGKVPHVSLGLETRDNVFFDEKKQMWVCCHKGEDGIEEYFQTEEAARAKDAELNK